MELKVWVEGIQRIVCGVTDTTTCQDVVYALAHATGQTGRFTLVERWRNNTEMILAPHDRPLRVLAKWGEHAGEVQLILKRSAIESQQPRPGSGGSNHTTATTPISPNHPQHGSFLPPPISKTPPATTRMVDGAMRKISNLNDQDARREVPRGAVRGTAPQQTIGGANEDSCTPPLHRTVAAHNTHHHDKLIDSATSHQSPPVNKNNNYTPPRSNNSISAAIKSHPIPPHAWPSDDSNQQPSTRSNEENVVRRLPGGPPPYSSSPSVPTAAMNPSPSPKLIMSSLSPPPYRSPPSTKNYRTPPSSMGSSQQSTPRSSSEPREQGGIARPFPNASSKAVPPPNQTQTPTSRRNLSEQFHQFHTEKGVTIGGSGERIVVGSCEPTNGRIRGYQPSEMQNGFDGGGGDGVVKVVYDSRYRDLVRLVNLQKDRLNSQQAELTQYDAEIGYWEGHHREQDHQAEAMVSEMRRLEMAGDNADEEVARLDQLHLEDSLELGHQQEMTLQSELTLLRSKLANGETELLQCKNKIRILMDEITEEWRVCSVEDEERRERERNILNEIENLQRDLEDKIGEYDSKSVNCERLMADVANLEAAISRKKAEVDELVNEMRSVNLESLSLVPTDPELKYLLEGGGPLRPGSTRKMVGSPRQLENAVPTSKNPHGVWV